jgi:hypothetical protein
MLTDPDEDGEQRILLSDFGIARNIGEISGLTATNMTVGTVAYCAPEQLTGEELDGHADEYALAATAYHLLTGSQLFPHSNPAVVISHHLNSPPPALADTHPDLAALDPVLATALAKDPGERFESAPAEAGAVFMLWRDYVGAHRFYSASSSPTSRTLRVLIGFGQVPVQRRPANVQRPADGGGGLAVALHPAGKRGLVGVEFDGPAELHTGAAGVLQLKGNPLFDELALVLRERRQHTGHHAPGARRGVDAVVKSHCGKADLDLSPHCGLAAQS